jgi:hypothetical protein
MRKRALPFPKCFDPYLRYAISTDFVDFEFFHKGTDVELFFLVEFDLAAAEQRDPERGFADAMKQYKVEVEFGPANDRTHYRSLRTDRLAVLDPNAVTIWDRHFTKVELSLPLKPKMRVAFRGKKPLTKRSGQVQGSLLIGQLDDGCPFAAAQFLRSVNPPSTRVLGIWDQDQSRHPAKITDASGSQRVFGRTPPDLGYGLEYQRVFVPPALPLIGFDEWMQLHLTRTAGSVDEDSCYLDADFERVAQRESHGAHVMDVLAGRIPTSSRIGSTQPNQDHPDPPTWQVGGDRASSADIVFVQFAENCIEDSTGVWLKAYVLDGINYILSFADPAKTERVIINLSYGPTTGPHDGTAALESALWALVTYYDGVNNKPKLEIFVPAGNTYLTEGHVNYTGHKQGDQIEWTWRLLPDNPVLCFAEVWIDSAQAGGVTVTLIPPGGGAPQPITPQVIGNGNTMWQLNVNATVVSPLVANPEPHGDYTIEVTGIGKGAQIDAYVARTDPNMGVVTGAKPSYFVDPNWEQTRSAGASCTYVNGEFDKTGSLISSLGTLNGIATAIDPNASPQSQRVHIAGGDILANARKAPYASAGPARGQPKPLRIGPDFAMFCDESYALQGVRAGGSRSGAVFRLIGTSTAAPQLARQIAGPTFPAPTDLPTSTVEKEKRGAGNIAPP